MLRILSIATLAAASLAATMPAAAQDKWPTHAITIVGGFPNGSGVDLYARKLGQGLTETLGVPIVVEARTGAGGNVASDAVSRAAPDGYTFLFGTAGTHAINAALYKSLSFDVWKDFSHIALLGDVPNVLLVNPQKHPDINTCKDLLALARKTPGKMNYSYTCNGTSGHLPGAHFTPQAQVAHLHVP